MAGVADLSDAECRMRGGGTLHEWATARAGEKEEGGGALFWLSPDHSHPYALDIHSGRVLGEKQRSSEDEGMLVERCK